MPLTVPRADLPGRRTKLRRLAGIYALLVGLPATAAVLVAWPSRHAVTAVAGGADSGHLLVKLLAAATVVVALATLGGTVARRLGQPRVVGELVTGLALGPSLLGLVSPGLQQWLFPAEVLPHLDMLAQIGVVLFMFLVGTELSPAELRADGVRSIVVGHASIAMPFVAGVALAWHLRKVYPPTAAGDLPFMLFVGLAFAITAFPVLARILAERGMLNTRAGTISLAAAGIGDVTAWCMLAVVVAIARNTSVLAAAAAIVLVAVFTLLMLYVVRPLVHRVVDRVERTGSGRLPLGAGLICLVLASALATEQIGVHPIFGAFLAGVIMPRGSGLVSELTGKIEGVTLWLMLPLFFVIVGLQTSLGGLTTWEHWLNCLLIIVVAVVVKVAGTAIAARATGSSGHEALQIGVMMNCRGLTELVVLNIGLQIGVLGPDFYAMFVIMALLTTAMTGPLLRLTSRPDRDRPHGRPPAFSIG